MDAREALAPVPARHAYSLLTTGWRLRAAERGQRLLRQQLGSRTIPPKHVGWMRLRARMSSRVLGTDASWNC
eukprot:15923047-Heterocapsa_arctica.AAC.1